MFLLCDGFCLWFCLWCFCLFDACGVLFGVSGVVLVFCLCDACILFVCSVTVFGVCGGALFGVFDACGACGVFLIGV